MSTLTAFSVLEVPKVWANVAAFTNLYSGQTWAPRLLFDRRDTKIQDILISFFINVFPVRQECIFGGKMLTLLTYV